MTKQEYYDLLVNCASNGTFPSVDPVGNECRYRLDANKKCAVGILIPDQDYYPALEGKTCYNLPAELVKKILPEGMRVTDLRDIQLVHDKLAAKWHSTEFITELNNLFCFQSLTQAS